MRSDGTQHGTMCVVITRDTGVELSPLYSCNRGERPHADIFGKLESKEVYICICIHVFLKIRVSQICVCRQTEDPNFVKPYPSAVLDTRSIYNC